MKNIYELLKAVGIDFPEDKKAEFDTALKENYITTAELEKVRTARDNYKTQLDTATTQLKSFEGVDVADLQGKITTLNQQLADQKADFDKQLAERDFNDTVDRAIAESKGKNTRAIRALLDLDTLRKSKNQAEDINKALETVRSENDYLFSSDEPFDNPNYVDETHSGGKGGSLDAMRAAMGLPPETK